MIIATILLGLLVIAVMLQPNEHYKPVEETYYDSMMNRKQRTKQGSTAKQLLAICCGVPVWFVVVCTLWVIDQYDKLRKH